MEESSTDLNFSSALEEAKYWREKVRYHLKCIFDVPLIKTKLSTSALISIEHYKLQATQLEKETKEVKEEFQEFQEGSRELEAELETQLEQVNVINNSKINARNKKFDFSKY